MSSYYKVLGEVERTLRHMEPITGRNDIRHLDRRAVAQQVIGVYEQVLQGVTYPQAYGADHGQKRYPAPGSQSRSGVYEKVVGKRT